MQPKMAPPIRLLRLLNGKSLEFSCIERVCAKEPKHDNKCLSNDFSSTVHHNRCNFKAFCHENIKIIILIVGRTLCNHSRS